MLSLIVQGVRPSWSGAALACIMSLQPVAAVADISPSKASDIVVALSTNEGCLAIGKRANGRLGPKGSVDPFTIPAGYSFMVTGLSHFATDSATAVYLRLDDNPNTDMVYARAGTPVATAYVYTTLPVPVRFSGVPCILPINGAYEVRVYGFLLKD